MKRALPLALLLLAAACSKHEPAPSPVCAEVDAGAPVDPLLLAFLSRARAAHHVADNQESSGALADAVAPLASLVAGPLPKPGTELAPEVREVLADTRARLADLRSRLGAFDEALADVHAGLAQVSEPNYFRGHLLETEGLIEERHAKALEATDPSAAARTRKRAIELLEQAMSVQSGVIEAAPSAPTRPPSPAESANPRPAASGR